MHWIHEEMPVQPLAPGPLPGACEARKELLPASAGNEPHTRPQGSTRSVQNTPLAHGPAALARARYCESVGVTATIHQLRHSFATELVNAGVRLELVREWEAGEERRRDGTWKSQEKSRLGL